MVTWLKSLDIAKAVFMITLGIIIFLMGTLFARNEIYPYSILADHYEAAIETVKSIIKQTIQIRPRLLEEIQYPGDGVTYYDQALAFKGLTLVQGVYYEGVELRLLEMNGKVVHRWRADFHKTWPNPNHVFPTKNIPVGPVNFHTQGMWALPDGSVIFNFAELGTVKLDKCGNAKWTIDRMTHHSLTPTADGSFWIPVKRDVRKVADSILLPNISREELLKSNGWYEDLLILVNAEGKIKKEISVLQALFDGGYEDELFDVAIFANTDPTHVNDIEVVTPALANKINNVNSGDLLISIREMHMLAILDQHTGEIKWHQVGPWIRQHDPDITIQGTIEVFNNGQKNLNLNRVPGSNIITLDPTTGENTIVYPRTEQSSFYSEIMGTHQLLPNNNRLITESMAGRVFEITPNGKLVWELVAPYDDTHAAMIDSAIRYEQDYFVVQDWTCT